MGETKTALQAGSYVGKIVAAIEGYPHLLSDATEAQVQAAYAGTDWASTTIIPGLTIELANEQALNPWQPFHGGGRLSLIVKDSIADTFGIDVHRKTAGDETILNSTLDSNDTTVAVLTATDFDASGEIHIGTECIAYTGTTGTTFTGCTRGKYSPFGVDGGTRFGRPHRVRNDLNGVTLKPKVTAQKRTWLGAMVGLWMHRNSGGTLDTKAQAQLVFAGRIVAIRDDPETQSTIVECEHVLDWIAGATLGREQWAAKFEGGIYLKTGMTFTMTDNDDVYGSGTNLTATPLVVVASGATAPYEINAGIYSAEDVHRVLNDWLSNARVDGDVYGRYSFTVTGAGTDDARTRLTWQIDKAGVGSTETAKWTLKMPRAVATFMGFGNQGLASILGNRILSDQDYASDTAIRQFVSSDIPYRSMIDTSDVVDGPFVLSEETGSFSDQRASLPAPLAAAAVADHDFGICVIDNKHVVRCALDQTAIPTELKYIKSAHAFAPFSKYKDFTLARLYNETPEFSIRQIFVIEAAFDDLLRQVFYSTGTSTYNHATYDVLPFGVGLGIPGTLLGDTFEASLDALPGGEASQVLILDKPTSLAELFTGDLVFRWAFLRWKDQALDFAIWPTPTSGASVATLTEATKAAPDGQSENHRTASRLTDEWQRNIVKLEYDRDFGDLGDEKYFSLKTFEDPGAIDDCGGVGRPVTLRLPHMFGTEAQVGAGVDSMVAQFIGVLTLFTRGSHISTRSIDARYWEGYSVGDVVLVTDEFARDPDTGMRGVATRPGIIVRHRWQPGGGIPDEASEMSGEVDILFLAVNRIAKYVPCAQVDDTATNAGYNAGTKVLTCYAHKHSESSEAADATYFPAGAKVRVVEIDPADPTAPTSWDDTVASQTGNTITLTTGLAGWDNTLKYRVISDTYGDASATQQSTYAYQADDADGLVGNARAPYEYAASPLDTATVTANSADDQLELPPNSSYGDAVGRDIGTEAALMRLLTNVIDYKAQHSSPCVSNTVMSGTGATGTYKLVDARPVFLGGDTALTSTTRNVSVAPWYRSSDGTSATVRLSLVRALPETDGVDDVNRGTVYSEATWTTTSTTWGAGSATNLSASVKDSIGIAYLLVECTVKAETRGAAKLQVGPRT